MNAEFWLFVIGYFAHNIGKLTGVKSHISSFISLICFHLVYAGYQPF